ncbi:MAG: SDR family oxidoreductase [Deltaproteobacteria bacterium]|nr:SDR family oxidoreductase [Deltaproteobacteria bacterium]
MGRLSEKVAVITGAAGDIGLAAAQLFAKEGGKVVLVDVNGDALNAAARTIGNHTASLVLADVTDPIQVQQYIQSALDRHGRVDVFVNNAGIEGVVKPIPEYPVEVFDRVMAVNVRGVWLGMKYMIPVMMKAGGGSIIITSSIAGIKGSPLVSAYIASKHACVGIMRAAAMECAEAGIRVNTVNPAPIETRMMRSLEKGLMPETPSEAKGLFQQMMPLGHYGTPEDVAYLMLFLASDESRYCTGGVYMVDGGTSAA